MSERAMSDLRKPKVRTPDPREIRASIEQAGKGGECFRFLLTVDRRSVPSGFASTLSRG